MSEEKKLIDDAFYVKKQRWGTWDSYDKKDKPILTSLTEDICVSATRHMLKWRQEGFPESQTYKSVVDGKL